MTAHLDEQIAELAAAPDLDENSASHLADCTHCASLYRNAQESVATLLMSLRPTAPAPALREQILRAISDPHAGRSLLGFRRRIAKLLALSEDEVSFLLSRIDDAGAWLPFGVEGIDHMLIAPGRSLGRASANFVRCSPGVELPYHSHDGVEISLMLRGAAEEDSGRMIYPGDFVHKDPGTRHSLTAIENHGCLFVVLHKNGLPRFIARA